MDRKRDEDPEALAEPETDFAADSPDNPSPNPTLTIFTQPQPLQRMRSFSAVGMEAIRFCYSPAAAAPVNPVSPLGVTTVEPCAFPRDEQLYFGNDGIYQGEASPFFSAAGKGNLDDFCLPPSRPLDENGLSGENLLLLPAPFAPEEGFGGVAPLCNSTGKKRSFSMSCDFYTPTILDGYLPFPFGGGPGSNGCAGVLLDQCRGGSGIRASCDLFEYSLGSDEHEH